MGYWDDPYYIGWSAPYYDYGYPDWRPRLWRHYRRPLYAVSYAPVQPAVYTAAVDYGAPADCGGSHYVWDDYAGAYVFRPYAFPC